MGDFDEPSNSELARGIADIKDMVRGLVGKAEYTADQRATDYRFRSVERDIEDNHRAVMAAIEQERRERTDGDKAVNDRVTEQAKTGVEHRYHWRTMLLTGVLPALATIAGIVATIIISRGGK